MGRIVGIRIKNYGSLKDVKMGKLLSDKSGKELASVNAIIGQSGTGKSTLADAFKGINSGFLEEENKEVGDKVDVELVDPRQLGIVTLGELKEHPRIVKFKKF